MKNKTKYILMMTPFCLFLLSIFILALIYFIIPIIICAIIIGAFFLFMVGAINLAVNLIEKSYVGKN